MDTTCSIVWLTIDYFLLRLIIMTVKLCWSKCMNQNFFFFQTWSAKTEQQDLLFKYSSVHLSFKLWSYIHPTLLIVASAMVPAYILWGHNTMVLLVGNQNCPSEKMQSLQENISFVSLSIFVCLLFMEHWQDLLFRFGVST